MRARCQGGITASTVTQASGNYSLSVAIGAMPCALQVAPTGGGQLLYSVASVPNLLRAWTKVRHERRVDGSVESRIDAPAGVVVVRE